MNPDEAEKLHKEVENQIADQHGQVSILRMAVSPVCSLQGAAFFVKVERHNVEIQIVEIQIVERHNVEIQMEDFKM
jgi:hypothetical protein